MVIGESSHSGIVGAHRIKCAMGLSLRRTVLFHGEPSADRGHARQGQAVLQMMEPSDAANEKLDRANEL